MSDRVSDAEVNRLVDGTETAAPRARRTRDEAISFGAALGLQTATEKGETGQALDQRVARAKAYAAWEWDGKPEGGKHLVEFGVAQRSQQELVAGGSDWKKEKRKAR